MNYEKHYYLNEIFFFRFQQDEDKKSSFSVFLLTFTERCPFKNARNYPSENATIGPKGLCTSESATIPLKTYRSA